MAKEGGGGGGGSGGGGGGKLRTTRSTRRTANNTPYDRPQTGRHAPAAVRAAARGGSNNNNSNERNWIRRVIVDPAHRLINNGAAKWVSSVFTKRSLPEPPSSDEDAEVQEDILEEVADEAVEDAMVTEVIGQGQEAFPEESQRGQPEFTGLEEILKNKTFSREEFNRLMEVLQTRIVDGSSGMQDSEDKTKKLNCGNEPNNLANAEAQRWREERKKAREEKDNPSWDDGMFSNALSPAVTRNVCHDAGSSPADIAKAFMGVRSHRTPASSLALPRRPFGDESTPNRLFRDEDTPNRPNAHQPVTRTTEGWVFGNGQVEDRFKTPNYRLKSLQLPRSQNRVQGFNGSPYARNLCQHVRTERMGDGNPISTPASRWTPIQSPLTGGRQMLKRRRSMLDDGLASEDSIRSIRQKSSLRSPLRNQDPSCSTGNQPNPLLLTGNDPGQNALATVFRKPIEREKWNDVFSSYQSREEATKDFSATLAYVPQQSSETARKILEHLDRMVPSPKEKSAEAQLAIARAKSPSQLNVNMLNGNARRSTETIATTHFLDVNGPSTSPLQENNLSGAQGASGSDKKSEGKGKSPLFNYVAPSLETATTSVTRNVALQCSDVSPSKANTKVHGLDGPLIVLGKNKGFRMSALEESDDEGHVSQNATTLVCSPNGKGTFTSHGNITDGKTLKGGKETTSTSTVMTTKAEANGLTSATSAVVELTNSNSLGFTFPVAPTTSNFPEPPTPTAMPSPLNKDNVQSAMDNIAPTYNFGSASTSKGPVFSFSTTGCPDVDTTKPEFDFKFESKPEESFSSTAVAAAAAATASTSTLPLQTSLGSLESSAPLGSLESSALFKSASASGLSGNLSSITNSSTIFSISTTVATPFSSLLFGGPAPKTDGINSVSFSSPGTSSSGAAQANNNSNLIASSSNTQGGASSTVGTGNLVKSFISGDQSTVKSDNELKASNPSPCPSLFGLTNAASSTSSVTSATSNSTNSLLPNVQSTFAGSLFGQASSSAPATTSATFMFGGSASLGSPSSSISSVPVFSSSSSISFCGTSPSLFGSTLAVSASSGSASSFGSSTPSSFSSASLPSFGLSSSAFSTSTSAPLFSGSTPASGTATTTTFGASSNPSLGSSSTSFNGSSTPSFGLGSTPQFGSNASPSFGLSTTPQFGSNTSPSFGLSTTPQFGSSTSPSFGLSTTPQFGSNTSPSFGTFGANATSSGFASGSSPSFGSGSTPSFSSASTFGSGSSPSYGGSSSALFGSASTPAFGGSSASFASSSTPALSGSSASFVSASNSPFGGSSASFGSGSTLASSVSSSLFGSSSTPMFGSSSTSLFGMAQTFGTSSTTSSSQSAAPSFGSGFGSTPALASTGFPFGGSATASSGSFTFGASGNASSGSGFVFTSTSGALPSPFPFGTKDTSTVPQQSIFGLTNSTPTFGATASATQPTDQMEDSMAEDPAQVSAPPVFGGQSGSSASPFMFSSQPTAALPGQSVFQFGAQPSSAAANPFATGAQSTFNSPAPGLEFSGGSFSLGAGGEKPGRKFIKAKRDKPRRK